MTSARIVVQCATPPEFQAIHKAFSEPPIEKEGRRRYFRSGETVVLRGAVGKVWAAASAEFAIGKWRPEVMIDFGAAGGLVSGLEVGDLVVAEKIFEHDEVDIDGNRLFAPEPLVQALAELVGHAPLGSRLSAVRVYPDFDGLERGLRVTRGALACGDKDIQTLDERRALGEKLGAIAATWESAAIGRIARFHGVSFLSVRVITDVGRLGEKCISSRDEFLAEYRKGAAIALGPAAQALVELLTSR